MPRLPLPPRQAEPPETPEELFGRLQVRDPGLDNLWSQQADVLRVYAQSHQGSADVALELPTGSGKTLVGLLIAEWRRLRLGERTAFVCPTNQLARQAHAKAAGYGIETVLLIGPSENWRPADTSRFTQSRAVAITNYNHIFNRTPRIEPQALIMDDAHTAEGPVADRWSLRLGREDCREAYFAALTAISSELADHERRALLDDDLDPAQRSAISVLLPDATRRASAELARTIPEHVDGRNEWYAWDAIDSSLETCIVYAAWSQILIRPFIAPTFAQDAFVGANQRVYLSATLGAGGELERSFARSAVHRIPQPADWDREGSGRRYILAPGAAHDGSEANELIRQIVDCIGRVLLLAPSDYRLERAAEVLLPEGLTELGSADIEESLDPFVSNPRAALELANRYDGIDLPGQACRLIILSGLPSGTHLQERFLFDVLGARHVLAERIRTRITQGAGRATRARRDTAVVLLHGDDIIGFLSQTEVREVLRSELQSELELAFSTAHLPAGDVLVSVNSFLAQDQDWQPTEEWLRGLAQESPRQMAPGAEQLAAAAPHEIDAWQAAWRRDYSTAVTASQRAIAALNHPTMAHYRAWWTSLAASWSIVDRGDEAPRSVELTREAALATRQMRWRPALGDGSQVRSADDALALRAESAVLWLKRWVRSPKLERELTGLESKIGDDDATKFELGVELLGTILGFESVRPAAEADPDGAWRDGGSLWLLFEAKTEEQATGEISASEIRQANTHADWVRSHFAWPEPDRAVTVLVTYKTRISQAAAGLAAEELHLVTPEIVREIAARAVALHRELAGELVGLGDADAIERMAALLTAARLTTPNLAEELTHSPLR
jgi:Type III restriction enzyme, res subunit